MRLLGLLVFVYPVTRRLQRVLTPAWTTLKGMVYRSLSNHKQCGANEERAKHKCWKEHVWSSACLFTADFGSSLFVFRFFLTILLTKWMHDLFLISTGRQPHAFEEELLVVVLLLFRVRRRNWSKVGRLETRKLSFHCLCISALFSISWCQYCRRGYTKMASLLRTARAARICRIKIHLLDENTPL